MHKQAWCMLLPHEPLHSQNPGEPRGPEGRGVDSPRTATHQWKTQAHVSRGIPQLHDAFNMPQERCPHDSSVIMTTPFISPPSSLPLEHTSPTTHPPVVRSAFTKIQIQKTFCLVQLSPQNASFLTHGFHHFLNISVLNNRCTTYIKINRTKQSPNHPETQHLAKKHSHTLIIKCDTGIVM